jgi:hypothetical protein
MDHSAARKLIRAATLSVLVLTTTSGMAGLAVMAASPAMAQPDGSGGGSAQGWASDPTDPPPSPPVPIPLPGS